MKSWKILVACIRKDFSLVKRELVFFSAASRTNPLITVISGVLGLINSLFFMIITVNAVIEHKYFFLLAPRKETN